MNSATQTRLRPFFLSSILFALMTVPTFIAPAAAKSTPAKSRTQAKSQIAKSHAASKQRKEAGLVNRGKSTPAPRLAKVTARDLRGGQTKQSSGKRQRAAEQRAAQQRAAEARRQEARRQAEANRQAAIARQRAADAAMRDEVQSMIARDNTAGEDMEVRAAAVKALGHHAGTVVVMDPTSGRVYSMVNQEWAVRRGFKPCSTIKLVTGIAGLNEGVIDQFDQSGMAVSDSNHIGLTKALAYSRNEYFQHVGGRVGFEKMLSYSRTLGLGEKTGINSPDELKGQIPSRGSARIYSHGDDFKVTPLQLATLVSAMANGGKLLRPHISRSAQDNARYKPRVRRLVNIQANTLASMVPGMVGAVNYGSGRKAHHSGATVAGKTGTCIEQGTWVGLFASYAPIVNPRLAVVVIARGPDARSHFPAAVAGRIYRDLNSRFGTPTYMPVASAAPRNLAPEEDENAMDEEEMEEERYNNRTTRKGNAGRNTAIVQTRATESVETSDSNRPANGTSNNKVRRVLMTIPSLQMPAVKPVTAAPASQTRPRRVTTY